jgi:amidase
MVIRVAIVTALVAAGTLAGAGAQRARPSPPAPTSFSVVEASISDMRDALDSRRVTSHELVRQYLSRIERYDPILHATLAVNRRALEQADARDRDRAAGRIRSPLDGIPIAIKDNIQTVDMPTTGGALAFRGFVPRDEATVTTRLRAAGAIVIAKTGMTELANWVAGPPTPMPNNYNAVGGFGFNPYDPRSDPRATVLDGRPVLNTGGSSSGVGTAASLWAANVGTETSGSILNPSNQTMLVGIKPTVGRVSRYGVIPIASEQDTPGPMARTVSDAAILLGVLEGGGRDPRDPATTACAPPPGHDYRPFLKSSGLRGARIGIPRAYFYEPTALPGRIGRTGGLTPAQSTAMDDAIDILRQQGAIVVDPANIPSVVDEDVRRNLLLWGICAGADEGRGHDEQCSVVLKYGMKRDFNRWLRAQGGRAPVKTLKALRAWNLAHERDGAIRYGQAALDISDEVDVEGDRVRQQADRRKDLELSAAHGIDEIMQAERLDALLFPGANGAAVAARPGYPSVIVPFALVPNAPAVPFPQGFAASPSPFGVTFTGRACSEPRLVELAYAFEQATRRRIAPAATP